jgi:AraC-like DNA-binding protein
MRGQRPSSLSPVRFRRSFPPVAWLHAREAEGLAWPTVVIDATVSGEYRPKVLGPLTLFTIDRGAAELVLEGRRLPLVEQTYALSPAHERFTLEYPEDVTSRALNVYFSDDLVRDVAGGLAARSALEPGPSADVMAGISYGRMRPMGVWLRSALDRVRRASVARESLVLDEAVADLLRAVLSTPDALAGRAVPPSERHELRRRIARTIDYLVANSDRTLSLAELSKVCGVSRFHFLRVFRDTVGSTPSRFLTGIRIERAKALLRTTERSVTDIALDVGFSEQSAFTRAFRRQVGASPVGFRARERP